MEKSSFFERQTSQNKSAKEHCKDKYILCIKCHQEYIGQTGRTLAKRFSEHQGYVRNKKLSEATGSHFNEPGHQMSDMKITVLEKVHNRSRAVREQRESMFIREFETEYKGLNKNKWKRKFSLYDPIKIAFYPFKKKQILPLNFQDFLSNYILLKKLNLFQPLGMKFSSLQPLRTKFIQSKIRV